MSSAPHVGLPNQKTLNRGRAVARTDMAAETHEDVAGPFGVTSD